MQPENFNCFIFLINRITLYYQFLPKSKEQKKLLEAFRFYHTLKTNNLDWTMCHLLSSFVSLLKLNKKKNKENRE